MCVYQRNDSLMRCCRHTDGRCLDGDAPCSECDTEGYPLDARRRLKRTSDDLVEDVDDGQRFRVKRVKGEMERLVPHNGRVKWNTEQGFTVMQTLLSCLGANGEYVLWDEVNDAEMDVIAWIKQGYGFKAKVPIRHNVCKEVVKSTCIDKLQQGQGVGCTCNSTQAKHWRNRRSEVVEIGKARNFEVVTTEEDWIETCDGRVYCPTLRCTVCKEVVKSTSISSLQHGHGVGCTCNSTHANHWRHRRSEVVEMGKARNFEVVTTEEDWIETCDGSTYYPSLRCTACNEPVTSTCISSLQQGQGIGCSGCRNKTEGLLLKWLQTRLPSVTISTQHRGPKTTCGRHTHFDFHLAFPDGFGVLLELDGAQHFWNTLKYFSDDGCERDLLKETWALQQGLCVIRVLQEDVWNDRLDWQGWILRSIEAARECGTARVFTPDAPEYRSNESAYVKLHESGIVPT